MTDAAKNRFRCDQALVDFQVFRSAFQDLKLIRFVVDGERTSVIERFDLTPKQAHAKRMKGRNQRISGTTATQKVPNAELHLIGGFVRERDGEDVHRTNITVLEQMINAINNEPCL